MTVILTTELTNGTTADNGTGVFDVLMRSAELHIVDQFELGRITGEDYAKVYLGALQATLAESIRFLLEKQRAGLEADLVSAKIVSETKNNEANGVIDLEKLRIQAETSLVSEKISSEVKNNEIGGVIDLEKSRIQADIAERQAATTRADAESAERVKSEIKNNEPNGVIDLEKLRIQADTAERNAATIRLNNESIEKVKSEIKNNEPNGVIDLEKLRIQADTAERQAATIRADAESVKKVALMTAQTTGFKVDAKQKMLKQMLDGHVAALSLAQATVMPQAIAYDSIDAVANDILNDLDASPVIIQ